ncbi:hypothetical protein [Prescottella agglutinans]|uniref:hypothetical protein n=1 Tax=Prescottella agglutinans TaxID=1644129 RepID=UPI003D998AFF
MSEMWVDPGRLVDAARVAKGLGESVGAAKPAVVHENAGMFGFRAVSAAVAGGRSAARATDVVGDGLRRWATTAERSAGEYARVDEATADRLVEVARALPAAGAAR